MTEAPSPGATWARAGLLGILAVALAVLLAFLPRLGTPNIRSSDEARPALIAREMRASGQWAVPRLGGRPHAATLPLFPWTVALASPAGVSEWSLRLPSALAAAATAGVTGLIAARLVGPLAGVVAAALFASGVEVFAAARTGRAEMLFTLLVALAFWSATRWLQAGRLRDAGALGLWVGLGALTQGLVSLVPLLVIAGAAIGLRRPAARTALHLGLALGVAVAVVGLWLGAVALTAPDAAAYLESLQRRVLRDLGRARPRSWSAVLDAVGGGFLPWSLLLPGAVAMLVWSWRNEPSRRDEDEAVGRIELWLPALWAAVFVTLHGAGAFGRGVGPLAAFPALAIAAAWAWHAATPRGRWALGLPVGALALGVALGGAWIRWQRLRVPIGEDPEIVLRPTITVVTLAICAAVAAGAAILLLRARRPVASVLALAIGALASFLVAETALRIEAINHASPTPLVARRFARQVPDRARVAYLDRELTASIVFYMPHESVRLSQPRAVARIVGKRRFHVVMVERDFAEATGPLGLPLRRQDTVAIGETVYVLAAAEGDREGTGSQ